MTFAEYLALEGVNWTTLKELRRSPKHYQHGLEVERADTTPLMLGRAVHTACFEPDRLVRDYAVFEGDRRAGKEWELFKHLHHRKTILRVDEYERALAIRDAVRSHPLVAPLLVAGAAEQTVTWTHHRSGLACKARLDWVAQQPELAVVDLKTSRNACDARLFAGDAFRLGYFHQLAHYTDGLAAALGKSRSSIPAFIVAVESAAPHDVAVYRLSEDARDAGSEEVDELLEQLVACRAAAAWPGRHQDVLELDFPRWAFPNPEDVEVGDEPDWMNG